MLTQSQNAGGKRIAVDLLPYKEKLDLLLFWSHCAPMNKNEFAAAFKIAKSEKDLSNVDDSTLWGCGLPEFKPVAVTLDQVAKFIRWQCFTFAGTIDAKELDDCHEIARRKFLCVESVDA